MEDQKLNAILLEAYNNAPPYIQAYLSEGKFTAFMQNLMQHFGIHADIAGKVENEIFMTIIGLTPPTELPQSLVTEAGLAPGIVDLVLQEINTEIFIPLRDSLQVKQEPAPVSSQPAPAQKEEWVQVTPSVETTPAPSVPPKESKVEAPVPAPVAPYTPPAVEAPTPTQHVEEKPKEEPARVEMSNTPPVPEYHEMMSMMRTMSKDIESLKGGVRPEMTPWKPFSVPSNGTPEAEKSALQTPYTPPIVEAPAPASTQYVEEKPRFDGGSFVVPPRTTGGDPYREPVE